MGVVEVAAFEFGVAVIVQGTKHVGCVQSDGEAFADAEGIAPIELVDATVASACSSGFVTFSFTSTGFAPGQLVTTTPIGGFKSGIKVTGIFINETIPKINTSAIVTIVKTGRLIEKSLIFMFIHLLMSTKKQIIFLILK